MLHPRQILIVLLALPLLGLIAAALLPVTYAERSSPDGAFRAVATARLIHSLIPVMPGGGGDRPGRLAVYARDGRSCGAVPLEMVSMIHGLRWDLAARPRRADLAAAATWNLDACTVGR